VHVVLREEELIRIPPRVVMVRTVPFVCDRQVPKPQWPSLSVVVVVVLDKDLPLPSLIYIRGEQVGRVAVVRVNTRLAPVLWVVQAHLVKVMAEDLDGGAPGVFMVAVAVVVELAPRAITV
jgi:hypothetical protein